MATDIIHNKAVQFMVSNEGKGEVPMGSNTGPFVESCQAATWVPGTKWPWCVAAWVKAWTVAGYKLPYRGAAAYAMSDWYKTHLPKWWLAPSQLKLAKPGAAIIIREGSGHCAMLLHPYDGGAVVHTVDGNWGDEITVTTHPANIVYGIVDPPELLIGKVIPAKPPLFEVVTSASNHSKVVFVGRQSAVGQKVSKMLNKWGGVTIRRHKVKVK